MRLANGMTQQRCKRRTYFWLKGRAFLAKLEQAGRSDEQYVLNCANAVSDADGTPQDALLPPEPVHNVDPGLLAGPPPLSSTAGAGGVVAPLLQQAPAVGSYAHHLGVAAASSGGHLPGASSNGYLALHGQMNGHFPESSGYREAAAPRNVPMPQSNEQLLWAMQGTVHGYNNQNGHGADRPYASAQTPGAHGGGWMQGQAAPANVSEHSYRTPPNDKWEPDIGRGYSDSRPGPRDGGWRGSRHQRKSGGGWSSSGDRHGARR